MRYVKLKVYGKVQGVGMRYFIKRKADNFKVFGYAKNLPDSTVEVLLIGDNVDYVIEEIREGPPLAKVTKIDILENKEITNTEFENLGYFDFEIY
ncbi:MAG: acylphosphatase [bacterium]|jgi:acylphosphatase